MFYRWRRALAGGMFNRQIAGVLETPPLRLVEAPLSIVSMVSIEDLRMYLVAIKSFYARVQGGRVVAIITRASPRRLWQLLDAHVPGIEIVEIESIPVGSCRRGGCWERLLYIADRSQQEYVVQLDSDTLTIGPDIPEVTACIAENCSFVLGGGRGASGQEIVSMPEAAASINFVNSHINVVAQLRLGEYPDAHKWRYVRGSGAFAGFARGSASRQRIEEFDRNMARLMGERWAEWGSEQCASNFTIANASRAIALPWPQYVNFEPSEGLSEARFVHFLGAVRYAKGCYAHHARQTIERIMSADAAVRQEG